MCLLFIIWHNKNQNNLILVFVFANDEFFLSFQFNDKRTKKTQISLTLSSLNRIDNLVACQTRLAKCLSLLEFAKKPINVFSYSFIAVYVAVYLNWLITK